MKIIPAIDLKEGQCVRLLQGKKDEVTVYSDDPGSTAKKWVDCGAEIIHIVDLDGAFTGTQKNISGIEKIRKAVDVTLELGGGIRDMERIRFLTDLGIDRIIIGTAAIENPELLKNACREFPGRVFVGIDTKDGMVAVKGWEEITQKKAIDLSLEMEKIGVAGIIYTDIRRDGMLTGPNIEATREISEAVTIPVIASGGISGMDDIRNLLEINGLYGAITGKAIYSGAIDLREAIELSNQ